MLPEFTAFAQFTGGWPLTVPDGHQEGKLELWKAAYRYGTHSPSKTLYGVPVHPCIKSQELVLYADKAGG